MTSSTATTDLPPPLAQDFCPFVGLEAYGPGDAEWFFGREADSSLLSDNIIAHELTIAYGPSGAGKSSLVNAGVISELQGQAELERERGRPPFVTVAHRDWSHDPIRGLDQSIARAVARQRPDVAGRPDPALPLDAKLADWSRRLGSKLYVILDQFEEYFVYHRAADDPATIEIADAIAAAEDGSNFLVVMRDDSLAKLDRFEGLVPGLFDNYYRIEHLDLASAEYAIKGALQRFNDRFEPDPPITIEQRLIDEILDKVRRGNVVLDGSIVEDRDEAEPSAAPDADAAVETAQLQLVLERLWAEEIRTGGHVLRGGTLERLGGAEAIIRRHFTNGMDRLGPGDQQLAFVAFQHLVTPSRSKIALAADDLADYADVRPDEMVPVLERLSEGDLRILRPVVASPERPDQPRYEIFHDVLAGPILTWSATRRSEMLTAEADAEVAAARAQLTRERRRRIATTGALVIMVALAVVAVGLWRRSVAQQARNESQAMAADSLVLLEADPADAAELAADAYRTSATDEAEEALRASVSDLNVDVVLSGHTAVVTAASFFPAGSGRVATASADGTARIWDERTGLELQTLTGHEGAVFDLDVNADGSRIWTRGVDETVRVWDAGSGDEVAVVESGTSTWFPAASFDSAGQRIAATPDAGAVDVWDARSGEHLESLPHTEGTSVGTIAFAGDADREIMVTGDELGSVRVWDASTWELLEETVLEFPSLSELVVTPDLELVVIGTSSGEAIVWEWQADDTEDGARTVYLDKLQWSTTFGVDALDVSGRDASFDEVRIATGGDQTFQLWRGGEIRSALTEGFPYVFDPVVMDGHVDWVTDVDWSDDGQLIATAGLDGRVIVRDGDRGGFVADLRGHEGGVNDVDFGPDNRILTASNDRTARIWAVQPSQVYRGHDDWVLALDTHEPGDLLVTASADGAVRGFDLSSASPRWEIAEDSFGEPLGFLSDVDIDGSGDLVAAGGVAGYVDIWDSRTSPPTEVASWAVPRFDTIVDLAFDPAQERLAITVAGGTVYVWSWASGEAVQSLVGHRDGAHVAFSPDGDLLATGGGDGAIKLWDSDSGALLGEWDAHLGGVTDVAFSPDGSLLSTAGSDRVLRLWELDSQTSIGVFENHRFPVTAVAFDEGGRRLVSGDQGGFVAVWDVEQAKLLSFARMHEVYVNDIAFGNDGARIISAGDDDVARSYACRTCGSPDLLLDAVDQRMVRIPDAAAPKAAVANATNIPPGTCTAEPEDSSNYVRLGLIDCSEPHAYEYFASFVLLDEFGEPYPGLDELFARGVELCEEAVDSYFGGPLPSELSIDSSSPVEAAWDAGGRVITCEVGSTDGSLLTRSYRDVD